MFFLATLVYFLARRNEHVFQLGKERVLLWPVVCMPRPSHRPLLQRGMQTPNPKPKTLHPTPYTFTLKPKP